MNHGVSFGGEVRYEYLILGAGPAGLQMGHHLSRAGHSYLILEAGDSPGTFFKKLAQHRTRPSQSSRFDERPLLDEEDDVSLRFDGASADEMVRYLARYAAHHRLNVRCDTRVLRVEKTPAGPFRLTDAKGNVFSCRRLIVATGTGRPWVPSIPGIDQAESCADLSADPEDFTHQRVLVIGTGSAAVATADDLTPTAAFVHTVPEGAVERVERREGALVVSLRQAHGEVEERVYERVIVATGFRFDDSIFARGCRPALRDDGRLPAQTAEWEAVNVPGLYFAGTLAQESAGETRVPGFRYTVRALFRLLEVKHHRRGWPARAVEPTPEGLVEATLDRVNYAPALWQQPGLLHDAIVVDEDWNGARYFEEMPLAYVHQSGIGRSGHYYTIALEPGETSAALHPVVRRWSGGQLISERHLPEDPRGEWKKPEAHVAPLRYFYMQQLLEIADLESARYDAIPVEREEPQRMLRIV
jgi:cation diffusion facilitator CzcD-associated flavoprotein CzcO